MSRAIKLGKIIVRDATTKKRIVLLTNNLEWVAATVADVYKERWQTALYKAEFEDKTLLWEHGACSNDADMDSIDSVSFIVCVEGEIKDFWAVVY